MSCPAPSWRGIRAFSAPLSGKMWKVGFPETPCGLRVLGLGGFGPGCQVHTHSRALGLAITRDDLKRS